MAISDTSTSHLADITPVDSRRSNRLLCVSNLVLHSLLMILFQSGWVPLMLLGWGVFGDSMWIRLALLVVCLSWLSVQLLLVFVYPEWPLNQLLCWRLRQSIQFHANPLVSPGVENLRVVELVPRERWRKLALDTATDLMLMRIDERGVWMTGDRREYSLPSESILGAELHSLKPSGWFTPAHMVILVVRTADGPLELPISYRDHGLGSLRSSRRRRQALDLAQRIMRIAKGCQYQPPLSPKLDTLVQGSRKSDNPYLSPAIVDEM
ncbi:MAG: hypothetical protein MI861_13855 [Pirellulales bacterium]|nr:hypothetical protein [Pirellulales bacterium]